MKNAPDSQGPRKTPVQSRSRERVERLLDAAAHAFAEVGYEAATTDAIAAHAGASIGSLYQFFPNKQALLDAVARRHLDRASELFDALLRADAEGLPWYELLDRAIDGFATLDRTDPNMRAVWRNWHLAASYVDASDALVRRFAEQSEAVWTRLAPEMPRSQRQLVATMVVQVINAMLYAVARRSASDARALLGETKTMLRLYIESYVDERPAPARPEQRRRRVQRRPR